MDKKDILSLKLDELENEIIFLGEKKFRAKQIYQWLHIKRIKSFSEMTNISDELRCKLDCFFCLKCLKISLKLESSTDNTVKYLYELFDGNHIESVLMDYKHGNSLCISTQVGCKMGCKFCASTLAGFKRDLSPSEMLLQLYEAERESGKKVSSIVLMGIGEPLDNFENVLTFLDILSSPDGTNMSLRHVSLSTCGLVDMIYQLAKKKYGLTLSISLHATTDSARNEIMPINKAFNIEKLLKACRYYINETGRRISFEYALIDNINNSKEDAARLISLLKTINCHVNIIPVNEIKERDFKSTRGNVNKFVKLLEDGGLNATVRRTLGTDINAACGQLRREYEI